MKPDHYAGDVDPIALMESQFNADQLYGFFAGNVIKYVSRAHKKNGLGDLRKARDYLDRLVKIKEADFERNLAALRFTINGRTG